MKVIHEAAAKLKELINSTKLADDISKFGNNNNVAGTRVRTVMQEIKNLAQAVREQVQAIRKTRGK